MKESRTVTLYVGYALGYRELQFRNGEPTHFSKSIIDIVDDKDKLIELADKFSIKFIDEDEQGFDDGWFIREVEAEAKDIHRADSPEIIKALSWRVKDK